jgi:signal transduction histidine kinase
VLKFPPAGADVIRGDRFYWDQIFFNLIENALKENKPGNLRLTVSMEREGEGCVIRVADNGIGIPRADLPFIFKRFYRVAKHHSQKIKGTGLGLSIVRRAVEAHGGTIGVDSTLGLETVFTIRLPDYRPEPAAEGAAA